MTRVRIEDLPPAMRAQVEDQLARRPARGRGSRGARGSFAGRCATCDAPFSAWAEAQRHADEEGHHRIDLVLGGEQ